MEAERLHGRSRPASPALRNPGPGDACRGWWSGSRGVEAGFSVFDDAADVVQRLFRQAGIFVCQKAGWCRSSPETCGSAYGTVIAEHRFWHKGRGLTEAVEPHYARDIFL